MTSGTAAEAERGALLANDVRVLTDQLNEKIRLAAEAGLRIEIEHVVTLVVAARPCSFPVLTARILAEVL